MRALIACLLICVAGCGCSYNSGPLAEGKRGPIERAEPASSSLNSDNQQMGLQLQNAEYKARTTPMLGPSQ
jgi:hypothetical protein